MIIHHTTSGRKRQSETWCASVSIGRLWGNWASCDAATLLHCLPNFHRDRPKDLEFYVLSGGPTVRSMTRNGRHGSFVNVRRRGSLGRSQPWSFPGDRHVGDLQLSTEIGTMQPLGPSK